MRTTNSLGNRLVAFILSFIMVLGMLPTGATAVSSSVITTTLGDTDYVVGQTTEFTVTTTGNEDAGTMVLGSFEIQKNGNAVNIADVAKLEYREDSTGTWYEFYGDFGPATTGFPLQEAATTSNFRVTFKESGEYSVKVFVKTFADGTELCAVQKAVSVVKANPATMTTTLGEQIYTVGQTTEFTVTTTGNEDAGTMVLGSFEIQKNGSAVNIADVAKLEYREASTGTWYEFYGDFGPAATGFPLQEAATTSNFRVTFKVHGEYTVKVFVKTFADSAELCAVEKTVSVVKANPATMTTTLADQSYTVGQTTEFTVTTTGNEDAGTMVLGSFEIKKNGSVVNIADVAKLEYREASTGTWYEFYGDFGPAATGFPLQEAATTSNFRVTFKEGGEYTVKVFVKTFADSEELCSVEKTIVVKINQVDFAFADKEPVISFNDNADNKYTFEVQNAKGTVTYTIESGSDIAEINAATGELTVSKPGQITVKASDSGNALYNPADATYTLTVNKDNQEITFATPVPEDQWIGQAYTNTASGGNGTGTISYWLVSGEELVEEINGVAKINKETGAVTFLCAGTQVSVKAVKAADDCYAEATATYSVTAIKQEPVDFGFTTSGPIAITYDPENLVFNNAVVGNDANDVVTWSVVSGTDVADLDTATGILTIKKAGTIVIKATIKESPYYLEKSVEYTLTVNPANQAALDTSNVSTTITYSPNVQEGLIVAGGGSGTGAYGYEIVEGSEFAEINATTGAVKILKAGNFVGNEFVPGSIKVKITKAADDCYNAAEPAYVTITLARAEQTGFGFGDTEKVTVTYNDNNNQYTLKATGGQSIMDVVYTFTGDSVEVNETTGVVTILKSGVITILATKPADDKYNAATDSYELTIEKDEQNFTFVHSNAIEEKYGLTSFETKITPSALNSGVITYAVSGDAIGATVNNSGVVSFANSTGKVGTITVTVTMVEDDCYKPFTDTYTITLGYETTPDAPYTLHGDKIINGSDWFTGDITILAPDGYQISYNNDLTGTVWGNSVVWGDKNNVPGSGDGAAGSWATGAEPVVYLKNSQTGAITSAISVADLKRDTVDPTELAISYEVSVIETILGKIFGFDAVDVQVTVTAKDSMSGIGKMEYSLNDGVTYTEVTAQNGKYTFTVPAQYRGQLWLKATDIAGNDTVIQHKEGNQDKILVVDDVSPEIHISYESAAQNTVVNFPYNKESVNAIITVDETNFFEGNTAGANNDEIIHNIPIKVTRTDEDGKVTVTEYLCAGAESLVSNANQTEVITWTAVDGKYTTTISFADDGDYVLEIGDYADFSGNDSQINGTDGNSGTMNYTSKTITIDKKAPVIDITYNDVDPLNENCYKDNRVATITVEEHNFKAEKFVVEVTAKDIFTDDVAVMDYAEYAQDPKNWKHNGNEHTLELTFSEDAIYTFSGSYADMAGNSDSFSEPDFVVDHTPAENIQITYTTPVFSKIIEALSFGFYKAEVVVTVTAEDMTSGVAYFELTYTRDEDATDAHTDDFMQKLVAQSGTDAKTFTASYTVPAQARGSYSVVVYDRAGNDSEADDSDSVIVTDTVSPEIKVDFTAKDSNTKVHFVDANTKNVDTFAESTNAFFNGDVVATITVDEANFFEGKKAGANNDEIVHEIIIKVTKTDDNGVKTVKEYLCAGAEQLVAGAQKEIIEWTTVGDTHTASITFADDGDYVLEIDYTDFSENDSKISGNDGVTAEKAYTSKIITVDETAPVIAVTYGNTEVINTIEGRKYFNNTQSAIITVTEHNFRAEDIAAVITAKDVEDADVNVADFAAQLADKANWKHDGNVHTAEVQYTVDANYTFDIDCVDLALNASADYAKDLFTVDNKAPHTHTVTYEGDVKTSVIDKILNVLTFGYYDAKVKVTITADDDISGVNSFIYSYITSENASNVNSGMKDVAIEAKDITRNGKTFTATFEIPKEILTNKNQFNGTVSFTAIDRAKLSSQHDETAKIIVDNIAPTANITYNAPVQTANGISYYDGNINATIVINEANFDAKDVVVSVTKNGAAFPVNVTWRNDSVDIHTGTFTLTEDGDYAVSVQYKDKSGNQMTSYTSNELTLDATKPTIKVSNIKANSANKDEKYGFVITVDDTNLDASSIKPVLKAVVQKEEGVYVTVDIDLGEATTVVNGQTYTYTVEDLPDDGLYTLTCEVKDMSANGMSQIVLDGGEAYDQVQFSINRSGSAFGYGNKFTEDLVGQYYIYSVDEDVVIVEVNVDPIEDYKVSLNGKELGEGTDYTTVQTSKDGEWSKRAYTIKKALFEAEGEYSIIVSSTDKADTTAFSDVKNLSLAFVVDQTKPVLTITGLEAGGRYQTDAQTVTLIPTDEGGRLNNLSVVVLDSNGNPLKDESGADISVRFEMAGEELLKYLEENDGKVTFTIPEGLNNQVKIICNDCAVNADDLTNEYSELFERVTVSQNQFVIFYANTPLFIGTIVGVLLVIFLIIFLIKRKKDKKNKKKAKV